MPPEEPIQEFNSRFIEEVESGLWFDPDRAPEGHLLDTESILLERRGITSQIQELPHWNQPNSKQTEFWKGQTIHKNTIASKLRRFGDEENALKLENCHSFYTICQCNECGLIRKFPNRCDQFFCPECQPGLSRDRKRQVEWWTQLIRQPKHVVLTLKNIRDLTSGHVTELQKYFSQLRRSAFATKQTFWWQSRVTGKIKRIKRWREPTFQGQTLTGKPWRGGFYSIECTNEGNGWHLHIHALIDADYIVQDLLVDHWQRITRGWSRIVKVKDCRDKNYLLEVTKYAVKGSQLAAWSPGDITTFITAFRNKRTFGVFGTLYGQRTEFAEFIATMKVAKPPCQCGSCNVSYFDEASFILKDLVPGTSNKPRPPTDLNQQHDLGLRVYVHPR